LITMEDADRLLLLALGRVGCSVPANVRSMADVVAANALPAMGASCLGTLDASRVSGAAGDGTVSPSAEPYPADAAARIRACEALAARMNALARSLSDAAYESSSKRWTCVDLLVPNASAARDACAFLLDAAYAARASAETSFGCFDSIALDSNDSALLEERRNRSVASASLGKREKKDGGSWSGVACSEDLAVACWYGHGDKGKSLSVLASKAEGSHLLYQLRESMSKT